LARRDEEAPLSFRRMAANSAVARDAASVLDVEPGEFGATDGHHRGHLPMELSNDQSEDVMFRPQWILPACLLLAVGLLSAPARATIVWQGQEVPAWPDLEPPANASVLYDQVLPSHLFPHPSGLVAGLVILVDFSDTPATLSKDEVDAWLNTKGYSKYGLTGSIRDYYLGQSNDMVDYQNEVHGYYRAKQPKSYYDGGSGYQRADELWSEVIAAMDSEIDFSLFDNDNDGKTEAISLLYAGDEGTFGVGLWPHASSSSVKKDGVTLNRYMMTALHTKPTNYVFAHESGHMLFGWPDLYGVGDYCIMANRDADTNPVGINDVFRVDQGWLDVVDIDQSTNASYTTAPDAPAYRYVNPAKSGEYFLWSNVQPTQEWVSLKGGGILVWHFDHSIPGNSPPATLELAVVQGGGSRILSETNWPSPGSAATDFFYQGNNSELGDTTKPTSAWNNGSASGLRIYDISANAPQMTFSVGTGIIADGGADAGPDAGRDISPDSARDTNGMRDAKDGAVGTGGSSATGGALGSGGSLATGGATGSGGMAGTGGAGATGGTTSAGGTGDSGGTTSSGGGALASGGSATGGDAGTGGTTSGRGGQPATGGSLTGGASGRGEGGSTTAATSSRSGCSCSLGRPTTPLPFAGLILIGAVLPRRCERRRWLAAPRRPSSDRSRI
jgi:M6 family metalloprotease-like protein